MSLEAGSSPSKKMLWTGRILSGLAALFLAFDAIMKLFTPAAVVQATTQLGYSAATIVPIGIVLLCCVAIYVIPKTSVFGAILLTGYLGGAVATNVRAGNPVFSYILAPVYVAAFLWLGLYLRDERLRALVPFRK